LKDATSGKILLVHGHALSVNIEQSITRCMGGDSRPQSPVALLSVVFGRSHARMEKPVTRTDEVALYSHETHEHDHTGAKINISKADLSDLRLKKFQTDSKKTYRHNENKKWGLNRQGS